MESRKRMLDEAFDSEQGDGGQAGRLRPRTAVRNPVGDPTLVEASTVLLMGAKVFTAIPQVTTQRHQDFSLNPHRVYPGSPQGTGNGGSQPSQQLQDAHDSIGSRSFEGTKTPPNISKPGTRQLALGVDPTELFPCISSRKTQIDEQAGRDYLQHHFGQQVGQEDSRLFE